ncbi:MAG: sensor histidine kinase [Streptomycetaceae bacterium]|nr:sensor histidine kinase [Streptomycetaceae bacterium]
MIETSSPAPGRPDAPDLEAGHRKSPATGRPGTFRRFGRELRYLLAGLPIAVGTLCPLLIGLSLGLGLAVLVIGLPVLAWTLFLARAFARTERRRVEAVTGRPLPPHHYTVAVRGKRPAEWMRVLRDEQSGRDVAHVLVSFPVRVVGFCFAFTWAVGGLGELLYGAWSWAVPRDDDTKGLVDLMFGVEDRWADIAFNTAVGVLLLATAVPVVRVFTTMQVSLSRALLTDESGALRARTEQLAASRRSAVAAEAQTLRRLERDLHDGPQQRLVRLTMDLEAVARRLDADQPARARPLVDEMLTQTHEALGELRNLSRGIAPPILADRGLRPALAAAAARCPVPVTVLTDVPDGRRYAAVVENTAYFVVAEALTNVAKHAKATRCTVTVTAADHGTNGTDALRIEIHDDGRGGAHLGKGHGLSGLADRLAAVDGTLAVSSPPGGPTHLTALVPLTGVDDNDARTNGDQ